MLDDAEGARIVIRSEEGEREIPLGERLSIGRSPDGELVLQELRASRSHAQICQVGAGRYRIRDLGSLNGTFVNGQRIGAARDLFHGDEIEIGSTLLRFVAPHCVRPAELATDLLGEQRPLTGAGERGAQAVERLEAQRLVALAVSVRSYGSLAEKLPRETLAEFMHDWQRAAGACVREQTGLVDEAIDGGVLIAAWRAGADPGAQLDRALRAARAVLRCAREMASGFLERFEIGFFEVGVGIELGAGLLGPGPTPAVGGEVVGVALALADLTKDKGYGVLASSAVGRGVGPPWVFQDLGELDLGEGPPVGVLALELGD